jgi:hypothetical protein
MNKMDTQFLTPTKKDKIEIKEKREELLSKQLKICERNVQELRDSIKGQTWESWTLNKEKRCKPKGYVLYSIK